MPDRVCHLVCNAHLDPSWLWEWEEGAAEAVSTFRTAAELCDEFEGFIFCHSESLLYEWVAEYEPALFERIKRLVAAGKWHVMGGWRVQPDCNMPSGEAFVRQALSGRRYFHEHFGVLPRTAINLDPFGHSRGLVQILAKSGYDSYLVCRPGQGDCPLPAESITWVGYDGSEIAVTRVWSGYNSPLGNARGKIERYLAEHPGEPCGLVLWGVGNHGGGPSRKDLRDLAEMIAVSQDPSIWHSTPETYFADLRASGTGLPRHEGDLNPWAVGCYTSQVRIKQLYRELENAYFLTEKMATAAWLGGKMDYPTDELRGALEDLLGAQFHDTLPGSSIQQVEQAGLRLLDHGLEIVSRLRARAFFALSGGQARAAEGEIPVLVYNPHPYPIEAIVECEFQLQDQNWADTFTLPRVWQGEREVPSQVEKEASNLTLDWRKRVVFQATLEPSRMNRFDCRLEELPAKPPLPRPTGDVFAFRGERVEVDVNLLTGLVDAYRVDGVDYLAPCAFEPVVMLDNEDPWGMTTQSFREVAGRFCLMSPQEGTRFSGVTRETLPSVRIVEDGPVRTVVEAVLVFEHSAICQRYFLPKRGAEFEVETRVHWNEKDRMLKLSVPVLGAEFRYLGQVAYGVEQLPTDGREAVSQKWCAVVADEERLLSVINAGSYGSDFSGEGLRLTLLRSPAYSGHPIGDRTIIPQDRYSPRIDQGERLFRFRVQGGPPEARLPHLDREALTANERPMALSFFPAGAGEPAPPLAELEGEAVVLTAAKRAEQGDDLVLRLFEPTGRARTVRLKLPAAGVEHGVSLGAFEIRTVRCDRATGALRDVDLLEGDFG